MVESYDKQVKKKRQAWKIYKALRTNDIYKSSDFYAEAYEKAKGILIEFHRNYTFKNSNLTVLEMEKSINLLADMEISRGKIVELTEDFISEFMKKI